MLKSKRKLIERLFCYFIFAVLFLFLSNNVFSQTEEELIDLYNSVTKDSVLVLKEKNDQKEMLINLYEMMHVPAGNFIMGSDSFDIDERPVREIFLDEYWIDKYPVTNEQYASFLNSFIKNYPDRRLEIDKFINLDKNEVKVELVNDRFVPIISYGKHPVIDVTWYGAEEFAKFYHKRLPTEAEWEKAARGFAGRRYPWGKQIDSSNANYWDSKDPFEDGTSSVGFYNGQKYLGFQTSDSQSPFGAYDMVGNVREWVTDWYQWNYYSKSSKINPQGPQSGDKKVVRGGGYLFHADDLRTTIRYALKPGKSADFIGFRCASSTKPD